MGVVLAGGAGRRLGGGRGAVPSKAATLLAGRPLVSYPLETLAAVCERLAIVCKHDTRLPADVGTAERWDEADEPRHPLNGIVHALERAGEPVLVCAADMPFVTESVCRALIAASAGAGSSAPRAIATVAVAQGALEPLLALYAPEALATMRAASADAPLRATIATLDPVRVAVPAAVARSVNLREDLDAAARELGVMAP